MQSGTAKSMLLFFIALISILSFVAAVNQSRDDSLEKVKNIILIIGDGMGYHHVEAGSLFRFGKPGGQVYMRFPVSVGVSTYTADGVGYDPQRAWSDFEYVKSHWTDSAAAATALATGVKTKSGMIGVDRLGNRLSNVVEAAEEAGKATGAVSSVPISHATLAGFVAHNNSRYEYSEIAREMLLESGLDVLMGANHPLFDDSSEASTSEDSFSFVGGAELWERLIEGSAGGDCDGDGAPDPWKLIETRDEFLALQSNETPKRILGIPRVGSTLHMLRDVSDGAISGKLPYQVPLNEGVPTLAEMTLAAFNVLDDDLDGFFVVVEGGAIDWAGRPQWNHLMIEEQIEFDKTVETVVAWIEAHSSWDETLLIVTADHENGYLLGPGSNPEWKPLVNNGKGKMPGMAWYNRGHANTLVPLYAKGRNAELLEKYADENDPVRGRYVDNTEIAKVIFASIGKSEQQ